MKVKTARKMIPESFIEQLKGRCLASIEEVMASVPDSVISDTPDGKLLYADRGSNILAVAHLDTVQNLTHFHMQQDAQRTKIFNCQLDDRLGAFIILDVLGKLGMTFDILLTEGEETARSTAAHFQTDKKYHWMFSFDRMGCDAVYYQYGDKDFIAKMEQAGFKTNHGAFSDIGFLEHLGCKGLNVGCGYYANHSPNSHCILEETAMMINKFKTFYGMFADTPMPHTPAPAQSDWRHNSYYDSSTYWRDNADYDWSNWVKGEDGVYRYKGKAWESTSSSVDDTERYHQLYLPADTKKHAHRIGRECEGCGLIDQGDWETYVGPDGLCHECYYRMRSEEGCCDICGALPDADGRDDEVMAEQGVCLSCYERYGEYY